MKQGAIAFSCGNLILDGYLYSPAKYGRFPGVIICHPHPLYGGSMNNNVIRKLAAALVNREIVSMLFNFRGVGNSQGEYGEGVAEQEDVIAAIDWLKNQDNIDTGKIGLAGYSFGAMVLIPVACKNELVKTMALISPVITGENTELLTQCIKPKLFVVGDKDDLTKASDIERAYQQISEPKKYICVPDSDHFWNNHIDEMVNKVADFLVTGLG